MSGLPVLDPPDDVSAGNDCIVGVLLAAGRSSRFADSNKLLAKTEGQQPIVTASARTLRDACVDTVITVVGYEAERVREALPEGVSTVERESTRSGLSGSVIAGVKEARRRGGDAVLIALGDMPWIKTASVDALISAYRAGFGPALAAASEGERGNPVLFDAKYFTHLESLTGEEGGRSVLRTVSDAALIETNDPGVRKDVDTRDDLGSCLHDNAVDENT